MDGHATITGHEVVKKNKTHFGMDDMKFDLDVGHATIHMDNLFNGNKALGEFVPRACCLCRVGKRFRPYQESGILWLHFLSLVESVLSRRSLSNVDLAGK